MTKEECSIENSSTERRNIKEKFGKITCDNIDQKRRYDVSKEYAIDCTK